MTPEGLGKYSEHGIFISRNGACLLHTIGDGGKGVPFKRESFIGLNEYAERLMRRLNMVPNIGKDFEILPPNCRFSYSNGYARVVVIEEPPAIRTIRVSIHMDMEIAKLERQGKLDLYGYRNYLDKYLTHPWKVTLSFPYIVYVITLSKESTGFAYRTTRAFFRLTPMSSIRDSLLYPNLLNTNENCIMCLKGREAEHDAPLSLEVRESVSAKVLGVLERMWGYEFNLDYNNCNKLYSDTADVSSLLEWEYNTKKDPMFIYSVNWLAYPESLSEVVNSALEVTLRDSDRETDNLYTSLTKACTIDQVIDQGKIQNIVSSSTDEVDLAYMAEEDLDDSIDSELHKPSVKLSVGDELIYKDKKIWVNGFLYNEKSNAVETHIIAETEDGKKERIKLTKTLAKLFSKQMAKKETTAVETNGGTISIGDLLVITEPIPMVKKVISVRVSRDGEPEAHLQGGHYLLNYTKYEKIDEKDFVINGTRILHGHEYIIADDKISGFPKVYNAHKGIYKTINNQSNLVFSFGSKSQDLKISINEASSTISKIDSLINTNYVAIGSTIMYDTGNNFYIDRNKKQLFYTPTSRHALGVKLTSEVSDFENILTTIFNGNTVTIPMVDRDITFSIGDKVIVADRETPHRMSKVSTIIDIVLEKVQGLIRKLRFVLTNPDEVFTQTFIDFSVGTILSGYIRKVTEEWNGIKIGMFFDPKKKAYGFPKNKRTIITAILTDTGCDVPMILSSNFNTIWGTPNNLELFEIGNTRKKVPAFEFTHEAEKLQAFDGIIVRDYASKRGGSMKEVLYHSYTDIRLRGCDYMDTAADFCVEPTDFPLTRSKMPVSARYINGYKYGIFPPRRHFGRHFPERLIPNQFSWYHNDEKLSKDLGSSTEGERENE